MAALSCCAVDSHVLLTIFTAYQCKVHRVVARKVHPSFLRVGKNYAWVTKFPHGYCAVTPVLSRQNFNFSLLFFLLEYIEQEACYIRSKQHHFDNTNAPPGGGRMYPSHDVTFFSIMNFCKLYLKKSIEHTHYCYWWTRKPSWSE